MAVKRLSSPSHGVNCRGGGSSSHCGGGSSNDNSDEDLDYHRRSSMCVNELRIELSQNDLEVDGSKEMLELRLSSLQQNHTSRSSVSTQSSSSSIACSLETKESDRRFRS